MKISNFKFQISNLSNGFTLIELLLVMGIISVLASFTVVNLIRPQTKTSLDSTLSTITSDLRSQQIKAMAGDTASVSTSQPHGIYFESTRYTLFKGSTYSSADTDNFVITLDSNITLSTTFPTAVVIFSKKSGEVSGFTSPSNTITISSGGESKVITVNRYGVISIP